MKRLFLSAAALAMISLIACAAVSAGELRAKADNADASRATPGQSVKGREAQGFGPGMMTLIAGKPGGLRSHTIKGGGKGHK